MIFILAVAGGVSLFILGVTAGKYYALIHLAWLIYTTGLLVMFSLWLKHLNSKMENLLLETPDPALAERPFPVKAPELSRVDRNLARLHRRLQLAEFTLLNQKARQAGENFNLMLSSTTDPLTGVPNRRELDRQLERVVGKMIPLSVIMADIDHFKRVNDTCGHDAGDLVLQQFASIVRGTVRPADFFGRYGGEEFMVLCGAGLEEAAEIAERARRAVSAAQVKVSGDRSISITASFGVAEYVPGEDVTSLVKRADSALYAAKQKNRNRVERGIEELCAG